MQIVYKSLLVSKALLKSSLFSLLIFASLSNLYSNERESRGIEFYQEYFKDILLVIHYNHPFYESMEFEKSLYSPVFKNIVC